MSDPLGADVIVTAKACVEKVAALVLSFWPFARVDSRYQLIVLPGGNV